MRYGRGHISNEMLDERLDVAEVKLGDLDNGNSKIIHVGIGEDFDTLDEFMEYSRDFRNVEFQILLHEDFVCPISTKFIYTNAYLFSSNIKGEERNIDFTGSSGSDYADFRGNFSTSEDVNLDASDSTFFQFHDSYVRISGKIGWCGFVFLGQSIGYFSGTDNILNPADGAPKDNVIWAYSNSFVELSNATLLRTEISVNHYARLYVSSATLGGEDAGNMQSLAISATYYYGEITIRNLTIQNADLGVSLDDGAILHGAEKIIFNNVTEECNIPYNEIQLDGRVAFDSSAPLTYAGKFADTAGRPATPNDGTQFFDTTLGKPIWFDGTNWVDATGTIV